MGEIGMQLYSNGERAYVQFEADRMAQFSADTTGQFTSWAILRNLYRAHAIVSFTRVGFNDAGDEAIVGFRHSTDDDWYSETILVRRINTRWQVARRHLEREHPAGDFVDGKCVPVFRTEKPSAEEAQGILGVFDFGLVSSATDDHIIPWRMRFLRDSSARAVFEVLDPQSGDRRKNIEAGTHINSGRFEFMNAAGLFQLDGSGFRLTIDRIRGDSLFGHWEHYSFGIPFRNGKPIPEPAGHFCAVRRP